MSDHDAALTGDLRPEALRALSFRKKPVVIDAIRWDGANTAAVLEFIYGSPPNLNCQKAAEAWEDYCSKARASGLKIATLEDGPHGEAVHIASVGDWIIRGVKGEFYPCKPDIFDITYEASAQPAVVAGDALRVSADINNSGEDWVQVTLSRPNAEVLLTEKVIEAALALVAPQVDAALERADDEPLAIVYRNWRGETSTRRIVPLAAPRFGTSEWHKEPQWLLRALDVDKGEEREFAMNDMAGAAQADAARADERVRCVTEMRRHVPIPLSNSPEDLEKTSRIEKFVDKVIARFGTTPTWSEPDVSGRRREGGLPFQARVRPWLLECFGEMIAGDKEERSHRFLEEALELVQACGATADEAHQLVDYVFGRDVGDRRQEIGGVMVTLAALSLAWSEDMHDAGEAELARVLTKVEKIRAKQAAKPRFGPLPGVYLDRAAPSAPVVVVRFDPTGDDPDYLVFGDPVRLFIVDEGCPGDRVYEILSREDPARLGDLVGPDEAIGSMVDARHAAIEARAVESLGGAPRLTVVPAEDDPS